MIPTRKDAVVEYQDRILSCSECKIDFTFTAGEQLFYADKGLQNVPKRCEVCRQAKKKRFSALAAQQILFGDAFLMGRRVEYPVACADCNAKTTVPFFPSQGRPVYCRDCFLKHKEGHPAAA